MAENREGKMGNRQQNRPPLTSASRDLGSDILAEACAKRLRRPAVPRFHVPRYQAPLDLEHALAHLVARELDD